MSGTTPLDMMRPAPSSIWCEWCRDDHAPEGEVLCASCLQEFEAAELRGVDVTAELKGGPHTHAFGPWQDDVKPDVLVAHCRTCGSRKWAPRSEAA